MSDIGGFVNMQIRVSDEDVMHTLMRLELALAPPEMSAWLAIEVRPYLQERAQRRFAMEGDDVSGKWEALSGATQHIRATQGYGAAHPINHRTGKLENFITGTPGGSHATTFGATLNFPGERPAGELRAKVKTAQRGQLDPLTVPRPVLGVNEYDLATILTLLSVHVLHWQQL